MTMTMKWADLFHTDACSGTILVRLSVGLAVFCRKAIKDIVLVEDKAELLVAFNYPATPEHPFMHHCHILEHEDVGMMGQYVCA
jgi:hypothetical protein